MAPEGDDKEKKGLTPEEETPPTGQSSASSADEGGEGESKTFDEEYVKQLRQEAKKWRIKVRELEAALEGLQEEKSTAEETELKEQQKWKDLADKREKELGSLRTELQQQKAALLRAKIAAEHGLMSVVLDEETGETLADRLKGETEEELQLDAARLAKLAVRAKPKEPSQEGESAEKGQGAASKEPAQTAARSQTSAVPGGRSVGRTDADRRREYFTFNSDSPMYQGGGVVVPKNLEE